jgi:predicted ester cyclase
MAENHLFHLTEMDVEGREPYRGILEAYRRAFVPRFSFEHMIAEGDLAAIHYVESGIFTGVWQIGDKDIPPTGKAYHTFGVEMIRVKGGQIVESWPGHGALAQYSQIGIVKI